MKNLVILVLKEPNKYGLVSMRYERWEKYNDVYRFWLRAADLRVCDVYKKDDIMDIWEIPNVSRYSVVHPNEIQRQCPAV